MKQASIILLIAGLQATLPVAQCLFVRKTMCYLTGIMCPDETIVENVVNVLETLNGLGDELLGVHIPGVDKVLPGVDKVLSWAGYGGGDQQYQQYPQNPGGQQYPQNPPQQQYQQQHPPQQHHNQAPIYAYPPDVNPSLHPGVYPDMRPHPHPPRTNGHPDGQQPYPPYPYPDPNANPNGYNPEGYPNQYPNPNGYPIPNGYPGPNPNGQPLVYPAGDGGYYIVHYRK